MHLNLFIVLFFPLFSEGNSLICYKCSKLMGSCVDEEVFCPPGTVCASTRTSLNFLGNTAMNISTKGCVLPETCGGIFLSYGIVRTAVSVQCCNTHLCNIQDVSDDTLYKPNGKQCYYCDENNCLNKLNCLGNEDYCITTTKTGAFKNTLKGCASKSICHAASHMRDHSTCCEGNLCNSEEKMKLHNIEEILNLWNIKDNLWYSEKNMWYNEDNLWDIEEEEESV